MPPDLLSRPTRVFLQKPVTHIFIYPRRCSTRQCRYPGHLSSEALFKMISHPRPVFLSDPSVPPARVVRISRKSLVQGPRPEMRRQDSGRLAPPCGIKAHVV